jgi:hypothetical protein
VERMPSSIARLPSSVPRQSLSKFPLVETCHGCSQVRGVGSIYIYFVKQDTPKGVG